MLLKSTKALNLREGRMFATATDKRERKLTFLENGLELYRCGEWSALMAIKDIFGHPAEPRRLVICVGPCCNKNGDADSYIEALAGALRASGMDQTMAGQASCVRRACLGKCTGEPLAYVDPDGTCYHKLNVENLLRILRDHLLCRQPVTELILAEDE
jgi:(2Fe-2S) ferredoxin